MPGWRNMLSWAPLSPFPLLIKEPKQVKSQGALQRPKRLWQVQYERMFYWASCCHLQVRHGLLSSTSSSYRCLRYISLLPTVTHLSVLFLCGTLWLLQSRTVFFSVMIIKTSDSPSTLIWFRQLDLFPNCQFSFQFLCFSKDHIY